MPKKELFITIIDKIQRLSCESIHNKNIQEEAGLMGFERGQKNQSKNIQEMPKRNMPSGSG